MAVGIRGAALVAFLCAALTQPLRADPLHCSLAAYRSAPGLTGEVSGDILTLTWDGARGQTVRLRLAIDSQTPTIRELAIKAKAGAWTSLLTLVTPDFQVVSGLRRMTNQQLDPLAGIGIQITPAILEKYKWEAFWDAPLYVPGAESAHNDCTPPQRGVVDQPGLPRKPAEIDRASAIYSTESCAVKTNGARLEVTFPGVTLGVFKGRLQFTVYKGSNLVRMEVIGVTQEPSVAYKYDAGVHGVAIQPDSRVLWQDVKNAWQSHALSGPVDAAPVILTTNDRIVAAAVPGGAVAAFPPPHNFFWARETSFNLGYNWLRKDSDKSFSFGVRQAEEEALQPSTEDRRQNFALRSARPGTEQRMPVYLYPEIGNPEEAAAGAYAFTRQDHFQPLPGFQVMATHFHMGLAGKAQRAGGPAAKVPDLEVLKAAGINIAAPIDGAGAVVGGESDDAKWLQWTRGLGAPPNQMLDAAFAAAGVVRPTPPIAPPLGPPPGFPVNTSLTPGRGTAAARTTIATNPYSTQAGYYETARRQSNDTFVVMANAELLRGPAARDLGGHSDILLSHPVYWTQGRKPGQPLSEDHPTYGKVYHLETASDVVEMAHRENQLIYMPHPESKGSTGFPQAIKDSLQFNDPLYRGIGFRWGMGLDGSEQRLCEYRCLPLFDEMNNWVAAKDTPPKFIQAISEIYGQSYGDDIYANNPVNYVKIPRVPPPGEWGPIIDAMKSGAYFVTSGEVLISNYSVTPSAVNADVGWTFPLEFVEIVWGDGVHTDRQVISATDLPAFGKHHFQIPFNPAGKKWIRFAAWDSAGNGALEQPRRLPLEK